MDDAILQRADWIAFQRGLEGLHSCLVVGFPQCLRSPAQLPTMGHPTASGAFAAIECDCAWLIGSTALPFHLHTVGPADWASLTHRPATSQLCLEGDCEACNRRGRRGSHFEQDPELQLLLPPAAACIGLRVGRAFGLGAQGACLKRFRV